jgi:hypothetical protein
VSNYVEPFVVLVLLVIFFSFSILLFILQQSLLKNQSLTDLHNLCFSIWYHTKLAGKIKYVYSNYTRLLIYVFFLDICGVESMVRYKISILNILVPGS